MRQVRAILAGLAVMGSIPAGAARGDLRSVAGMEHHNRVLVAFTPSLTDPRIVAQQGIVARMAVGAALRDLLFVQVDPRIVIGAHDRSDRLRRRFKVPARAYRVLLIDKDGRVLRESGGPIAGAAVLQAIDHVPVR